MHDFLTGLSEIRKGGSYYRFIRMIDALANRNLKILVYSISPAPLTKENVHWRCLSMISKLPFRNIMFLLVFPFLALHYIFKNTTGKIIVFGPIYASLLLPLRLRKRCRIYCMVRGMLSREYGYQGRVRALRYLVSLFEKVGFHVSHRIIVVSRTLEEKILEGTHICGDKIRHLPNEIPYLYKEAIDNLYGCRIWEEKVPKGGLRIFTGGIITPIKNFEMILNALALLNIPFHLCIVGKPAAHSDYAYFRTLQKLTEHLGVEEKVLWLGWLPRERLLGILATSHLLVGASHHEGMSNILLEALALDVPCLVKNTPESFELIGSKELLFETPEDLAKLLQKFYEGENFAKTVAKACKRAKERWTFNWEDKLAAILAEDGFDA